MCYISQRGQYPSRNLEFHYSRFQFPESHSVSAVTVSCCFWTLDCRTFYPCLLKMVLSTASNSSMARAGHILFLDCAQLSIFPIHTSRWTIFLKYNRAYILNSGSKRWHMCTVAQFISVIQSCLTLCNPVDCSMPGFPAHDQLSELAQTHVHWVGDATQPSHPLLSSSPTFNLS